MLTQLSRCSLQALESYYEKFDSDFISIRTKAREVLQREDDLNEIVQVCVEIFFLALKDQILLIYSVVKWSIGFDFFP